MKTTLKKIARALAATALCLTCAAQEPAQIVEQLLQKTESGLLKANYILTVTEQGSSAPIVYRGSIAMQGNRFRLEADGLSVAYDGQTQWAYVEDTEEINISEPTPAEAAEMNPLLMAKTLAGTCKMQFSSTQKAADKHTIDFFPDATQTHVKKLSLTLRKSDLLPLAITLREQSGTQMEITLSNQQFNAPATGKEFRLETADFPDAIVNDLR